MSFEIIDFHTHPFIDDFTNICTYKKDFSMTVETTKRTFERLGISKICGSVIDVSGKTYQTQWERIKLQNDIALQLREKYEGFYVPGFHVHPDYIEESIEEIHRMHEVGVCLIGELVPYHNGWQDYSCPGFSEILKEAAKYNMVVSFHSQGEDEMDRMVKNHPDVLFVAAHPGEYREFMRHLERMKHSENYYMDLSGYGIFRHGMLRRALDVFGADRLLFGSDYPTCNAGMYLGGVLFDDLISDSEKEKIFSANAKKLLRL